VMLPLPCSSTPRYLNLVTTVMAVRRPPAAGRVHVVKQVAARVGQHPDEAAATETVSAAAFKADVKTAVLAAEMQRLNAQHTRSTGRSTVVEYLNILGPAVTEFPNQLPKYLHTRHAQRGRAQTAVQGRVCPSCPHHRQAH
jgi:hypothetical protein